jgi:hypothetical protein
MHCRSRTSVLAMYDELDFTSSNLVALTRLMSLSNVAPLGLALNLFHLAFERLLANDTESLFPRTVGNGKLA